MVDPRRFVTGRTQSHVARLESRIADVLDQREIDPTAAPTHYTQSEIERIAAQPVLEELGLLHVTRRPNCSGLLTPDNGKDYGRGTGMRWPCICNLDLLSLKMLWEQLMVPRLHRVHKPIACRSRSIIRSCSCKGGQAHGFVVPTGPTLASQGYFLRRRKTTEAA